MYTKQNSNPYHYEFKFILTSNKGMIQNFINSKPFDLSKYKKSSIHLFIIKIDLYLEISLETFLPVILVEKNNQY